MAQPGTTYLMAGLIGVLFATGAYLLMQRTLTRIIIGLGLITHAANLMLLAGGGRSGPSAFIGDDTGVPAGVVDPLPQAMALTAIVIAFTVTAFLLALAYRSYVLVRDDLVQDDPEDARILRGPDTAALPPKAER